MPSDPPELVHALRSMAPRAAQVLLGYVTDGADLGSCARRYGVALGPYGVLLWRSARELEAYLAHLPPPPPLPSADEEHQAQELLAALAQPQPHGALAGLLHQLHSLGPEVVKQYQAAEVAYERSARGHRDVWLRRVAILVIAALALFFYLRRADDQHGRPVVSGGRVHRTP